MSKQTIVFEIDTTNITAADIESVKNQLAHKLLDEAFKDATTNAFHVKADFSKHVKGGISISGLQGNPQILFSPDTFDANNIQNIQDLQQNITNIQTNF